ncbi:MAG: glycosyltransferase family 2 protein [Patescibacteria group bacterium]|nr:glycosyltransferase family 2 protein [Patescibacteria group bacterium]
MEKIQASVTVLTYNSAATVAKTLESVKDFDEVLVLDGGSTDGTLDICKKYGVRIERQSDVPGKIFDFTQVRQRSFGLAKHDWIFWIDSDEYVDERLLAELRAAADRGDVNAAYRVERVPIINGRVIRYGALLPDKIVRLVNRKTAHWAKSKRVHEHVILDEGVGTVDLSGSLFTPWESLEEYRRRDRYYLSLAFSRPVTHRPSLFRTLKSILKNLTLAAWLPTKWSYLEVRHGFSSEVMPWAYQWRFSRYYLAIVKERLKQYLYGTRYVPPAA